MTPVGMLVGMAISGGEEDTAVAGFCTALAAGSFLYVAIVEVLVPSINHQLQPKERLCKLATLAGGFAAMSVLAVWV